MARKINVKLIMELRDAGLSQRTIASTRHISRHSVSEVFNIADEKGIHYNDVRALEETDPYLVSSGLKKESFFFYRDDFADDPAYRGDLVADLQTVAHILRFFFLLLLRSVSHEVDQGSEEDDVYDERCKW